MDVSQVNTDSELAAILAPLKEKLLMGGLDPDVAKDLNDQLSRIEQKMFSEQKRHESDIEARSREVKDLDRRIDRAPKRNVAA